MCVIYACTGKVPDIEELEAGGLVNDDGGGVAWVDTIRGEKRVRWDKGLKTAKDVHDVAAQLPLPVLIHFRYATIGGPTPLLTHPFPVTERVPLALRGNTVAVLMHNGHWGKWDDAIKDLCARSGKKLPEGPWSDSRAMAWVAANFGLGMLNILIGDSQKVAFLHATKGLHIINPKSWFEKDGWMQSASTVRYVSRGGWHGWDDMDEFVMGGRVRTFPAPAKVAPIVTTGYRFHTLTSAERAIIPFGLPSPKGADAGDSSAQLAPPSGESTTTPSEARVDVVSEDEMEFILRSLLYDGKKEVGMC